MKKIAIIAAVGLGLATTAAAVVPTEMSSWTSDELDLVRSLSLDALPEPPADPSNHVADDARAVELGRNLFFDTRLSANGEVACATCHLPDRQFQDDMPLAKGVGTTTRRTMPIAGAAYSPFLFWDGRKDSLWAQALGPLESAVEHGGNRAQYAHLIADQYQAAYKEIFGPLPDLSRVPDNAGPVQDSAARTAWEMLDEHDREAINVVFANIGKSIAAFERTITPSRSRFDDWVSSADFPKSGILSRQEIAGLRLFVGKAECSNCHNGPLLSDGHFHNTGVPAALGLPEDTGRQDGAKLVREDPFNCLGPYSDAGEDDCAELRFMASNNHELLRAFKTPSLRGAAGRAPYMHAGQIGSLEDVLNHYNTAPESVSGHSELRKLDLNDEDREAIVAFLKALDTGASD